MRKSMLELLGGFEAAFHFVFYHLLLSGTTHEEDAPHVKRGKQEAWRKHELSTKSVQLSVVNRSVYKRPIAAG